LFANHGYHAVSVREIARSVNADVAALYYHFPSKDSLLVATVLPVVAALDALPEAAEAAPTPEARARCILDGVLEARALLPEAAATLADPATRNHPELSKRIRAARAALVGSLASQCQGHGARQRAQLALALVENAPLGSADSPVAAVAALELLLPPTTG
jgi:AcrR family transcriptional regulator